jgi:hypothetical protein
VQADEVPCSRAEEQRGDEGKLQRRTSTGMHSQLKRKGGGRQCSGTLAGGRQLGSRLRHVREDEDGARRRGKRAQRGRWLRQARAALGCAERQEQSRHRGAMRKREGKNFFASSMAVAEGIRVATKPRRQQPGGRQQPRQSRFVASGTRWSL